MISTVIALPYEIARLPLALADRTLAARWSEESGPRVVLDRAIGSGDKIAGALLRNPAISARGVERLERSHKIATAARLEEEAEQRRAQARETAAAGRRLADEQRRAARDTVVSGLAEAEALEAREKQQAKARAAKTVATKKAAADQRAAGRAAAAEQQKKSADSTAAAKKKAVQRRTQVRLDAAKEVGQSAAQARREADQLSDLATARKQARTKDHPTG